MRCARSLVYLCLVSLMMLGAIGCQKSEPAGREEQKAQPTKTEEGTGDETAATDEKPIKIGAVFSITGPASFLGEPEAQTARMVVEDVNEQGGVNGRPIELLVEDTQGDETRTVNAVKKLIKEDVVAIIGPSRSGTTLAVTDLCNRMKVPLISCAASEQITNPVLPYVFKTPHKDSHAVQRIYDYMTEHGMKRVGIITGTTGFGAGGRTQLLEIVKQYPDLEIVADETYGPDDTDMTAQLTKIKQANVDAIVNWSIVPAQSIVLKNARQLEIPAQIFQSHGFGNIKYVEAAGDAANGVIFPAARLLVAEKLPDDYPLKDLLVNYKTEYEEKYDTDVSTFGGHALDALNMVLDACEKAAPERDAIRDHIEGLKNFPGTAAYFNFSPEDHTGLTKDSFAMLTVKDGKFELVSE